MFELQHELIARRIAQSTFTCKDTHIIPFVQERKPLPIPILPIIGYEYRKEKGKNCHSCVNT